MPPLTKRPLRELFEGTSGAAVPVLERFLGLSVPIDRLTGEPIPIWAKLEDVLVRLERLELPVRIAEPNLEVDIALDGEVSMTPPRTWRDERRNAIRNFLRVHTEDDSTVNALAHVEDLEALLDAVDRVYREV